QLLERSWREAPGSLPLGAASTTGKSTRDPLGPGAADARPSAAAAIPVGLGVSLAPGEPGANSMTNRPRLFLVAVSIAAFVVSGPLRAAPPAGAAYPDGPTSAWFKNLASAYTHNCCDQADCRRAMSDYRDGNWWALSNRTHEWIEIEPDQVTSTV